MRTQTYIDPNLAQLGMILFGMTSDKAIALLDRWDEEGKWDTLWKISEVFSHTDVADYAFKLLADRHMTRHVFGGFLGLAYLGTRFVGPQGTADVERKVV